MVEVVPGAHELAAVGLGEESVELGQVDALGRTGAPDGRGLGAAHPAGCPHVVCHVVVEGGEEGGRGALVAVVVESGQFARMAIVKEHPVEQAQVDALDERRDDMAGEREAPDGEGVRRGRRLRRGAQRGDDQSRVVLDADFANRRPFLADRGSADPGDGSVSWRSGNRPSESCQELAGLRWERIAWSRAKQKGARERPAA